MRPTPLRAPSLDDAASNGEAVPASGVVSVARNDVVTIPTGSFAVRLAKPVTEAPALPSLPMEFPKTSAVFDFAIDAPPPSRPSAPARHATLPPGTRRVVVRKVR